ncbi:MAG: hypothetical protein EZS28_006105 [Streblomastix strix]|uniref:Reverse transcriptase domain-containing protein n=1 Tax=Streblomastix strix TaxID=222440 RepID=A0A5J4WUA6_9EUKA|nr:MAG: hypothetical protein EZS28_006105 [Streblomastix strix]
MKGLNEASKLVMNNGWAITWDLQSAYSHITVSPELSKYLAFSFGGLTYTYTTMPFGIAIAPCVFTKAMRIVLQNLRAHESRRSQIPNDVHSQSIYGTRTDNQLREVDANSNIKSNISRNLMGCEKNGSNINLIKIRNHPSFNRKLDVDKREYEDGQIAGVTCGLTTSNPFRQYLSSSKNEINDFRQRQSKQNKRMGDQSTLERNAINQTRDTIMARQITQTSDIIPPRIPNNNLTNYGCIPLRVCGNIREGQFFDRIERRLGISCDTITEQERTPRTSTSNIQYPMRIATNQTRSRPFRVNMEHTATNFLFMNLRNKQLRSQFNNSKLETIQSSVCIPTTTVNYIDISKNIIGQLYCIDNYATMASSHSDPATLKNEHSQEDQSGLIQFNYQIRPSVQTIPNTITSGYTRSLTDQVVKQRIQEILNSVGAKPGSLMIASQKEYTWSSYKGLLASWINYAEKFNLEFLNLSNDTYITYLEHLHNDNASVKYIQLARTALSTIFSMKSGVKLSDDTRVSRLIRGAQKLYPEISNKQGRTYIDPVPLLLFWEKQDIQKINDNDLVMRMATILILFYAIRFREMSEIIQNNIQRMNDTYQIYVRTKTNSNIFTPVTIHHTHQRPGVSPSKLLQECLRRRENKGSLLWSKNGKALSPKQISQHISQQIKNAGITAPLKLYILNILEVKPLPTLYTDETTEDEDEIFGQVSSNYDKTNE